MKNYSEKEKRLIRLGGAVDKLFKEESVDLFVNVNWDHGIREETEFIIESSEDLLDWAEGKLKKTYGWISLESLNEWCGRGVENNLTGF